MRCGEIVQVRRTRHDEQPTRNRRGAATLDYVLVLGVIFPMAAFVMWAGPRMIRLAYEMGGYRTKSASAILALIVKGVV